MGIEIDLNYDVFGPMVRYVADQYDTSVNLKIVELTVATEPLLAVLIKVLLLLFVMAIYFTNMEYSRINCIWMDLSYH